MSREPLAITKFSSWRSSRTISQSKLRWSIRFCMILLIFIWVRRTTILSRSRSFKAPHHKTRVTRGKRRLKIVPSTRYGNRHNKRRKSLKGLPQTCHWSTRTLTKIFLGHCRWICVRMQILCKVGTRDIRICRLCTIRPTSTRRSMHSYMRMVLTYHKGTSSHTFPQMRTRRPSKEAGKCRWICRIARTGKMAIKIGNSERYSDIGNNVLF